MVNLSDTLAQLLQAMLIASIPIVTKFLTDLVKAKREEAEVTKLQEYMWVIAQAASDAVDFSSQMYVDQLKATGTWGDTDYKEHASKAMDIALKALKQSLTEDTKSFLATVYEDVDSYLKTLLEAEVHKHKLG